MSRRGTFVTSLLVSSTAMTLMACYGLPCPDEGCLDAENGSETGGGEACDEGLTPEALAPDALPAMVVGELMAQPGSNRGSCGGAGDEIVYEWTPPAAGTYRFAVQSTSDTVLYVRDASLEGSCGEELACRDDVNESNPELSLELGVDPVLIVVDNYSISEAGSFTLTVESQ